MRKSFSYKKQKRKMTRRKKRGGSYYAYNKNPLRFTSSTSQMGGSNFTMDTRNTLFPQPLVNLFRTGSDLFSSSSSTTAGQTALMSSDPTSQPYLTKQVLNR
jgi:hypothetical protein